MARKISQFSEYKWDAKTFENAYIPIIAPPENENNVVVVNEEDIEGNYINYKFKPKDFFLSKKDSYNNNSLIVTDKDGIITFKECSGGNREKYLYIDRSRRYSIF